MVWPRIAFALLIVPMYLLIIHNRDGVTLLAATFVLGAFGQMGVVAFVALSEVLPKQMRSAALAITYSTAISIFGGTTQFNITWLIHHTGNPMMPAYYATAAAFVGVVAMALMPETARRAPPKSRLVNTAKRAIPLRHVAAVFSATGCDSTTSSPSPISPSISAAPSFHPTIGRSACWRRSRPSASAS